MRACAANHSLAGDVAAGRLRATALADGSFFAAAGQRLLPAAAAAAAAWGAKGFIFA